MSTKKENTLWQVFSVYKVPNTDDYIKFDIKEDFINLIKKRSKYDFNTDVDINDKIITLSTCYGNYNKMVMHAKLIKKELK